MADKKSTGIVILNNKWEILLLKKVKNNLWTAPWWKMEIWEEPYKCAIRELEEETWLKNIKLDFFSYSKTFNNWINWLEHCYTWNIDDESLVKISETHTFSNFSFFDLNNLPKAEEIENYTNNLISFFEGKKQKILKISDL